jgi:hypothetical protein
LEAEETRDDDGDSTRFVSCYHLNRKWYFRSHSIINVDDESETDDIKKSKRYVELAQHMYDILSDQNETNVYDREFLRLCCQIVGELNEPKCPLTDEQLKNVGLDRGSMPSSTQPGTFHNTGTVE